MPLPKPDPLASHRLSLEQILRSEQIIPAVFRHSPQYASDGISAELGCHVTLKLECLNPIRNFKARGASVFLHAWLQRVDRCPLVCASAGNWGQAMAYLCREHGVALTVFASVNANALKVEQMRSFDATVVQSGADFDAAKSCARQWALEHNARLVEDGQEPLVSEGHGTIAIELFADGGQYDAIVVPLGNGALLNGIARWTKAVSPTTRVIGICSEGARSMALSWRHGDIVQTASANTIADGIGVRVPIADAVNDMVSIVDDVLLVSDEDIVRALGLVWRHVGLVLEPAGAASLAALLAHRTHFTGQRVATILTGSNITESQFKKLTGALKR